MSSPALPVAAAGAPMRAVMLMLAASLLFTSMDALGKYLTADYSVSQITWARSVFHMLLLPVLLGTWRVWTLARTQQPLLQLGRSVLLLACSYFFFLAVKFIPLADATAISFLSPLFVTVLSIPLLGERVGPRRWAAVIIGFASVLLIIRPGLGSIHWAASLPMVVALCFAFCQVSTRLLSRTDGSVTTLFYSGLVGAVVMSAVVPFEWRSPDLEGWTLMVALGLAGSLSHYLMIRAFTIGPASLLAPFGYIQLAWSTLAGLMLFGDFPDAITLLGIALIAGSGLYVLYRERRLAVAGRTGTRASGDRGGPAR
jgi:drug/metabolite transporter (DMT)-like permease